MPGNPKNLKRRPAVVNVTGIDAYAPSEIAARVETAGVTKAQMPLDKLLMLGVLAGAFIAFGAALYTQVLIGSTLGTGPTRLLGGAAFSLGLVLVVVGGAELFTGNNLIVMAWADGKISLRALLRNWGASYAANGFGAIIIVLLMFLSGLLNTGQARDTAIAIAETKMQIPFLEAFARGVLCNALVCMAIWLSFASHRVSGKILAILFPVTAFVALGFEHSIANFYLIPIGLALGAEGGVFGLISNLVPVTLGNIVGGGGAVAVVYWVIYRSSAQE
ncbi:MAG: formate/nitrite transporter family protein [Alphaproteobacteria bacterium]